MKPPDEKPTTCAFVFLTSLRIVMTSAVFPDTLVTITRVFESTVFGSKYPLTFVT